MSNISHTATWIGKVKKHVSTTLVCLWLSIQQTNFLLKLCIIFNALDSFIFNTILRKMSMQCLFTNVAKNEAFCKRDEHVLLVHGSRKLGKIIGEQTVRVRVLIRLWVGPSAYWNLIEFVVIPKYKIHPLWHE